MTVPAVRIASLNSSTDLGPISRPIRSIGIRSIGTTSDGAPGTASVAITTSTGMMSFKRGIAFNSAHISFAASMNFSSTSDFPISIPWAFRKV